MSLTGSASRTDLSQLANGIWEIHAGCPSFLRVSSVAKLGYIPQFKASNARDQDEVSSDLARMETSHSEDDDRVIPRMPTVNVQTELVIFSRSGLVAVSTYTIC